tara:strand:- start:1246 stop:1440 length:195 start_codon:yes stop_codon:yes gene_type:complete
MVRSKINMGYIFKDEKDLTLSQKRNRQNLRRWWRSFKKEGELMLPFLLGILLLGLIVLNFLWSI